nr:reverse transcriptase domain-containing protein [Tanacetum cinerariifolium]
MNTTSSSGSGTLPSNTITNPKEDLKGITTRSGNAYKGPMIPTTSSSPPKVMERETEVTKETMPPTNNGSTKDVQPLVVQVETLIPNSNPVVAPIGRALIDVYEGELTLRVGKEAVIFNLDQTPRYSANYDAMPVNRIDLIDVASIDDMPISPEIDDRYYDLGGDILLLKKFLNDDPSSPPLHPQELKVGEPTNEESSIDEPPVTGRALIDVYEGELTLRVGKEAVIFNLDQTPRYSANYDAMPVNRIDLIDIAYEDDFLLEETDDFLAIDDMPISPEIDDRYYDSEGDILLLKKFLNDDPSSPPLPPQELKVGEPTNEKSSIDEPPVVELTDLPRHLEYAFLEELKFVERTNEKYSIDEPPVVELKDFPPHLEYAFLEGDDKFPVIIAKDLKDEEKTALIKRALNHLEFLVVVSVADASASPLLCEDENASVEVAGAGLPFSLPDAQVLSMCILCQDLPFRIRCAYYRTLNTNAALAGSDS